MGVLSWIIVGIVAGWAACQISRRKTAKDYLFNSVVGVFGACAGGFTANLVGWDPAFGLTLTSFFVAILGTAVFLTVFNAIRR